MVPIEATSPSSATVSVNLIDVYCGPASERFMSPGYTAWPAWSRRQNAMFIHNSTNGVSLTVEACQPTIAREFRSMAKAT